MTKPTILSLGLGVAGCAVWASGACAKEAAPSVEETRAIAKDAFIYGFPLVTSYATLYMQSVDTTSRDYRGPEPLVVTMPAIEKNRCYSGQVIALYTFKAAYLGTRAFGNDDGAFLIADAVRAEGFAGRRQGVELVAGAERSVLSRAADLRAVGGGGE